MRQIECRHCESLILATYRNCPKCGGATRMPSDAIWYCGATWLLAFLAIATSLALG